MELLRFALNVMKSVSWLFIVPALTFWSAQVLVASVHIPYTWQSLLAFWILFAVIRAGVRAIKSPDWPEWISLD